MKFLKVKYNYAWSLGFELIAFERLIKMSYEFSPNFLRIEIQIGDKIETYSFDMLANVDIPDNNEKIFDVDDFTDFIIDLDRPIYEFFVNTVGEAEKS